MKSYIDIENSKTKKVETICVNVIKCVLDKEIIFDISNIISLSKTHFITLTHIVSTFFVFEFSISI